MRISWNLLFVRHFAVGLGLVGLTACNVPFDPGQGAAMPSRSVLSGARIQVRSSSSGLGNARSEEGSQTPAVFLLDLGGETVGDGDETAGTLRVIEAHDGSFERLDASPVALESAVRLEVHGESSAGLAKKSYQLELVDERGRDRKLSLAGLPPGSDWVLHSCASDRTCLRNRLAYALGREFGRYAPRTRFIELVVDGRYHGLYVLVERVRRDTHRVDLPKPAETVDDDLTGGYVFKMDLGEGSPTDAIPRDWVSPLSRTVYSYYYPRFNQITDAQREYLHGHVQAFETTMYGPLWNDPRTGYRRWIDVPSWVDFALIQELSMNPDAYFKSVYLQKWPESMGNKIALGPFWDFDLAFGQAEFRDARNTEAWAHTMNRFGSERVAYEPPGTSPYVPAHWERLWTDPAFQRDLRCRWDDLRAGPLDLDALHARLDAWAAEISLAQPRDASVWSNPPASAYQDEVASLKTFLSRRLAWMDANLPGRCVV